MEMADSSNVIFAIVFSPMVSYEDSSAVLLLLLRPCQYFLAVLLLVF